MNFVKLVVATHGTTQASLVCQKETAEYFGWDTAFPEWKIRWKTTAEGGSGMIFPGKKDRYGFPGGTRLRICRSKDKSHPLAGMTHCFRMQGTWSKRDLVRVAEVAGEKFEWMESTNYLRVSRDVWEAWISKRETPQKSSPELGGR